MELLRGAASGPFRSALLQELVDVRSNHHRELAFLLGRRIERELHKILWAWEVVVAWDKEESQGVRRVWEVAAYRIEPAVRRKTRNRPASSLVNQSNLKYITERPYRGTSI